MFTIPDIHSALEPLVCWSSAFTDEEIEQIIMIGDNLAFQEAKVGNQKVDNQSEGSTDDTVRKSSVSWIRPTKQTTWLFNKMSEIVARVNTDKFQFELSHIDSFQYTTYTEGEYYKWHIDGAVKDTFGPHHRKLGVSVVLSNPETEFTGGEFQIIPAGNPDQVESIEVNKGDILFFPSFVPHQVTEVLSGKRKSLVCWVLGSKFK
jgi:PKHD-type hydroxylase